MTFLVVSGGPGGKPGIGLFYENSWPCNREGALNINMGFDTADIANIMCVGCVCVLLHWL